MQNKNIWAPWRIEYLKSLDDKNSYLKNNCFLCDYWSQPERDRQNLVLWRTPLSMVLLNRFPYTGGHLLIAPATHTPNLDGLDEKTMTDMMLITRDAQKVLTRAIHPHGFNIGININRCAGAGLPDHIHLHVVPRWEGDTNFMVVSGQVRIISQALDELYQELQNLSQKMNLPQTH